MKVVVLGSGTSTGVPVVGCKCNVCTSTDPRNRRRRASVLISVQGKNLIIDTPPDFHEQALENQLERVDAVLFTHDHADHIFGLDELRIFNFLQGGKIPIYAHKKTLGRIQRLFDYIWDPEAPMGGGKPLLEAIPINGRFTWEGLEIIPIEIYHGKQTIYGYRLGNFAYLTDCSGIPDSSREKLKGLDLLILGALRYRPHPTHFSLEEALREIEKIQPERALLTHLSHSFDYQTTNQELPEGVELAYDRMVVELKE